MTLLKRICLPPWKAPLPIGKKYFDQVRELLDDFVATEQMLLAVRELDKVKTQERTFFLIFWGTFSTLVFGGVLSWKVSQSIAGPIVHIAENMQKISANEPKIEILGVESQNEIGTMARALRIFKDNFDEMVDVRTKLENDILVLSEQGAVLDEANKKQEIEEWMSTSLLVISSLGRDETSLENLCFSLCDFFAKTFEAPVLAFYVASDDKLARHSVEAEVLHCKGRFPKIVGGES